MDVIVTHALVDHADIIYSICNIFHFHGKHKCRDTFRDVHVQYHNFDNGDAFTYNDKYTALLQQELQNPYWCSHDPITTKSYEILTEMDIETMPHAMYKRKSFKKKWIY